MSLARKKSLAALLQQASESGLKRTLTAKSLVALGVGAIIGAGLFVRTAAASAEAAGAAVTLSFVVAAIGCAFAGLCYAEFAAMIPIAGRAYTYAYTTMWEFVNHANLTPYMVPATISGHEGFFKHGWGGVLGGAGIVFFAFIGFDAVSTAAQETKDPARDMPIGIMGSLALCTVLYILFGYVLTGICNWQEFKVAGKEASVAYAVQHYMPGYGWLATGITVA